MTETNTDKIADISEGKSYELTNQLSAVKRDPQARQRIYTLFEIATSILRREGLLGKGLTPEQAMEALRNKDKEIDSKPGIYEGDVSNRGRKAEEVEISQPPEKEIRVRLPQDQWEQVGEEARRLRISSTALARIWILEGLSRRN